jgi:quercetin dioxygenase-like cupin family protein
MNSPNIRLAFVSHIFTRLMHFKNAGDTEQGHKHDFDHVTLLSSGGLEVTVDEHVTTFVAPHLIFIHKDKEHKLVALEDNTVACCIHGIKDSSGDFVDQDMIPNGVNQND